jgi:hypothetical protein
MDFKTTLTLPKSSFRLNHSDSILCLGSCFAESVGKQLQKSGFDCLNNPFGVLYNPSSVIRALRAMQENKSYSKEDIFEYKGLYGSFDFHSSFSGREAEKVLEGIQTACLTSSSAFRSSTCLILSFGTAWVYELASNGLVVSNCHKLPASFFDRRRLSVGEMLEQTVGFFEELFRTRPKLKVLLTVSPIRHFKDGAHENTLSKAGLHLLVDELCSRFEQMVYFPAYELLMDDLRDYRFYEQDMLHPSAMAFQYIWERFGEFAFEKYTLEIIRQLEQIHKAMDHKPFRPDDEEYLRFIKKNIAALHLLGKRFPELNLEKERDFFESVLHSNASTC